jgi:hypothetical protein
VGTVNPFAPKVAVQRDGEWTYEANPRGGLEIWLGNEMYPHSTEDDEQTTDP